MNLIETNMLKRVDNNSQTPAITNVALRLTYNIGLSQCERMLITDSNSKLRIKSKNVLVIEQKTAFLALLL